MTRWIACWNTALSAGPASPQMMMTSPVTYTSRVLAMGTVIYVRQSLDRDGKGAAVDRQLKECRELCVANGWTVDQVYRDKGLLSV